MAAKQGNARAAPAGAARWLRLPLGLALVAGAIAFLPRATGLVPDRDRPFLVDPAWLAVESGPAWFSGAVVDAMARDLAELTPTQLRDDAEVAALIDAVAHGNGWIRRVERVAKRYPNQLELDVSLRDPVALVESDDGLVLIDAECVIVAPAATSGEYLARRPLPLVHLATRLRHATPGRVVRDPALEHGLQVALEIAPYREDLERRGLALDVIDVTAKERSGGHSLTDVEIYTRDGLVLEWGRARAHPDFGALEPDPDAKVRGLLRVAARYPELAGIARVRLQFEDPSVSFHEPLAAWSGSPLRAP